MARHKDQKIKDRDVLILKELSNGKIAKEIAVSLNLVHSTVETRIAYMRKENKCINTTQLVANAIRNKVIE